MPPLSPATVAAVLAVLALHTALSTAAIPGDDEARYFSAHTDDDDDVDNDNDLLSLLDTAAVTLTSPLSRGRRPSLRPTTARW